MITKEVVEKISSSEGINDTLSLVNASGIFTNFRIFLPLSRLEWTKLHFLMTARPAETKFTEKTNLQIALEKLLNCEVMLLIEEDLIPEKKYELIDKDNIINFCEENKEKIQAMLTKQVQDPFNRLSDVVNQNMFKDYEAAREKALAEMDDEARGKKRRFEEFDAFVEESELNWEEVEEYARSRKTAKIDEAQIPGETVVLNKKKKKHRPNIL